jgi:hypothetical protein
MQNSICETIYFVYLGYPLPKYAISSIKLAKQFSGMKVDLLSSHKNNKFIKSSFVNFTALEDFYDEKNFDISKKLLNNQKYRNNFWSKTIERFFVLEQFVKLKKISSFIHAELDQLLFGLNQLVSNIEKINKSGIFVPFHSDQSAVASIFYCNNISAFNSLIMAAKNGIPYRNEMELIAQWGKNNPNLIIALPTMASWILGPNIATPKNVIELLPINLGGVVDAAQIGQWVAGIDPRNISINKIPRTKFVDTYREYLLSKKHLEKFKFNFDFEKKKLDIIFDNTSKIRIFNLHIHSKIHQFFLESKLSLTKLFELANLDQPTSFRCSRNIQIKNFIINLSIKIMKPRKLVFILISRIKMFYSKINFILNRRPSCYPYISGDTFRKISDFVWENGNKNINVKNLKPGSIIFCESDHAVDLNSKVLSKIDCPVVLLLGNSDNNHDRLSCLKFKNNNLLKIYAQNLLEEIPEFEVLPIGIENVWRFNNGKLSSKLIKESQKINKKFRIMWAFNIYNNEIERLPAAQNLLDCLIADQPDVSEPLLHQKALQKYAFVASPPGNGLDTHRTWEAFYFKCVPIVKRSHMTSIYESIGLPIWIVNSYEELKVMNEKQLEEKYLSLLPKFNSKALLAEYWIEKIKKSANKVKKG